MTINTKEFSKRLKAYRYSLNLNKREFGAYFGVSKDTVDAWEKGKYLPHKKRLLFILKMLDGPIPKAEEPADWAVQFYTHIQNIVIGVVGGELDDENALRRIIYLTAKNHSNRQIKSGNK